jgi:peptidoglycan hydrolase CwlO-like protein
MAASGMATSEETGELSKHLETCASCRSAYLEYQVLVTDGMPLLASRYAQLPDAESLGPVRSRRTVTDKSLLPDHLAVPNPSPWFSMKNAFMAVAAVSLAGAVIFLAVRFHPSYVGAEDAVIQSPTVQNVKTPPQGLADPSVIALEARLTDLHARLDRKQAEANRLAEQLKNTEQQIAEVSATSLSVGKRLSDAVQQRDSLNAELQGAQQKLQSIQAELVNLRSERETAVLRASSLEAKVNELTAENGDHQRRLKDAEQYLESDRDIREMMGARKLYIADLFDVDSRSNTRKSFGRVFYAQGKSLVFYAFDLEPPSGIKNASFQAWGKKETAEGVHQQAPRSLGILYVDSELNHRWVLNCDDPKQLAEIDAVFVTVEPEGGSRKPTGKPLLYALLRKEVNHP